MARVTIKIALNIPRAVNREDWHAVIREQLEEAIPETVYYTTEDGHEYEISAEVVG
jgi:hypothetical protein